MDDWSLLPSRNAVSEPAPNPQSTMTTTTLPARLTHPRQAPPIGDGHPMPTTTALDPAGLARQPGNQSGAEPQNPNDPGHHCPPDTRARTRTSTSHHNRLDIPRPFMDDTGRPLNQPADATTPDGHNLWKAPTRPDPPAASRSALTVRASYCFRTGAAPPPSAARVPVREQMRVPTALGHGRAPRHRQGARTASHDLPSWQAPGRKRPSPLGRRD